MADLTAEERLQTLEKERKKLKEEVAKEKARKKAERVKEREDRDKILEAERVVVGNIQEEIYAYNKLGKTAKIKAQILDKIGVLCDGAVVLDHEEPEEK